MRIRNLNIFESSFKKIEQCFVIWKDEMRLKSNLPVLFTIILCYVISVFEIVNTVSTNGTEAIREHKLSKAKNSIEITVKIPPENSLQLSSNNEKENRKSFTTNEIAVKKGKRTNRKKNVITRETDSIISNLTLTTTPAALQNSKKARGKKRRRKKKQRNSITELLEIEKSSRNKTQDIPNTLGNLINQINKNPEADFSNVTVDPNISFVNNSKGKRKNKRNRCAKSNGGCSQICKRRGKKKCGCLDGYFLTKNRKTCRDIDECQIGNGGCTEICRNTLGSYFCDCPAGLRLSSDSKSCGDINECLLRNGHGPCQDTCVNNYGSYSCACSRFNGTKLSKDGHSCEDIDECDEKKSGCSHTCTNTFGSAYCSCPDGLELMSDYKTCQDMNECEDETIKKSCKHECINISGSYYCEKNYQNDDIRNKSKIITCPKLNPPRYGYIRCSRDSQSLFDTFSKTGRRVVKNGIGTTCKVNCPVGFLLHGSGRFSCGTNGKWSVKKGVCRKASKPTLVCPEDQILILVEGLQDRFVKFSKPKSSISLQHLKSYPEWARNFNGWLKEGRTRISFSITDPTTNLSETCSFTITIKK